jgi:hypothetical protein
MKQTQSAHRLSLPKWIVGFLITANLIGSAFAQSVASNFPNKPVRIIVPQTPGGASDALARIVGQKLSEKWGQPVVIENRPGAGGNIGMDAVAKAPGDGHTLLMSYVGSHAINPSIYSKLPFDPGARFCGRSHFGQCTLCSGCECFRPCCQYESLGHLCRTKACGIWFSRQRVR